MCTPISYKSSSNFSIEIASSNTKLKKIKIKINIIYPYVIIFLFLFLSLPFEFLGSIVKQRTFVKSRRLDVIEASVADGSKGSGGKQLYTASEKSESVTLLSA